MSALDKLLAGVSILMAGGIALPQTATLNFGSGLTATYNTTLARVDVTSTGGTVPTGTGFAHVTSGVFDAAARAVQLNTSDVTGLLSLSNLAHGSIAGQFAVTNAGATNTAYVAMSGDATLAASGALTVTQAQAGAAVCSTGGTWSGFLSSPNATGYALGSTATGSTWSALTLGYSYVSSGQGVANGYTLGLGAGGVSLVTGSGSFQDLHISNPATVRYINFEFGGNSGGDGCLSMSGSSANGTGNGVLTVGGLPETSSAYNKLGTSGWLTYLSICIPTGASAADPSGTPANSSVLYCAKTTGKMMLLNKGTSTAIDLSLGASAITSLTTDVTASGPGAAVATVTQIQAGAIVATVTTGALTWATTATPRLSQSTLATTPVAFTIQAGNVTTGTGSALVLTSGTGSVAAGAINIQIGGTTRIGVAASGAVTLSTLGAGVVQSSSGGLLSSSALAVSNISPGTNGQYLASPGGVTTWQSIAAADLPTITLTGQVTGSASGGSIATTLTSANLPSIALTGDVTGSASGGSIATTVAAISGASPIAVTPSNLQWLATTTAPTLLQHVSTTLTTGATLTIQAQNTTAASSTGGTLALTSGTGTTANGDVQIQCGGTNAVIADPNGVQLFKSAVDFGGGTAVLSFGRVSAVAPTALPSAGFSLYATASQELIVNGTGIGWTNFAGSITVQQLVASSSSTGNGTSGSSLTVQGQAGQATSFAAATGGNGANLLLLAGPGGNATGTGATVGGTTGNVVLNTPAAGTGATAGALGKISLEQSGTEVVNFGVNGFGLGVTAITSTSGTIVLTAGTSSTTGYSNPLVTIAATLTGTLTVTFPNVTNGLWFVDISGVVFSSQTLTLKSGSGSGVSLTALTTNQNILLVRTTGSNGIVVNL